MKRMEEIAVVISKFGDEQSTLMDQFERRSFELQLTQAILGRSLSEPGAARSVAPLPQPPGLGAEVRRGRCGSRFQRVLKKLLSPVLGKRGGRRGLPDHKDLMAWKAFSRSLRR